MPKILDKVFGGGSKGPVKRHHSVFGDFVTGDTTKMTEQERESLSLDLDEYNKLWQEYMNACGLFRVPTKKGFQRWLKERSQ